jgi:hypothetical protein
VWKAIARLRIERPDLAVCTLDTDYGIGVVLKTPCIAHRPLALTWEAVEKMSYEEFERNHLELLDLRPANFLAEILSGLSASSKS